MLFLNSDLTEYYPKIKKTPPLMKKNNLLISKYKLDSLNNQTSQKIKNKSTNEFKFPSIINLRKEVPKLPTNNNKILMLVNTNWISKLEKFVFLFNKKLTNNKNSWLTNTNSKEEKSNENIFITNQFGNGNGTKLNISNSKDINKSLSFLNNKNRNKKENYNNKPYSMREIIMIRKGNYYKN